MNRWKIIDNVNGLVYYPDIPKAPFITLKGICKPKNMKEPTVCHDILVKEITVIVQLEVNQETNGIRVWYPERNRSNRFTWYWQSSHFKNTLLDDPEFDALISPLLTFVGVK